MKARIVLIAIALTALAGCGGAGDTSETTVVAAFYPLAYAAERVAGPGIRVSDLTPAGAEPHDLELSSRDVRELADADLVLYLGGGFMPAVERAVAGRADALDLLDGAGDPHVWLDPVRFAAIARRVAAALGTGADAGALAADLDALDRAYRDGLARCDRRVIVTSHAAFGALARRYGLRQRALTGVSPEAEPGPRSLERLVDAVRASGATTVFFEPIVAPDLARAVAREAGVRTATLDPIESLSAARARAGDDFLDVMRDNLAALREALGCR